MRDIFWGLADRNAFIGIQCREYQKRHINIWGRRWWFLFKCIMQNHLKDKLSGDVLSYGEVVQLLSQYDVISFDIFDTLLVRPYTKPEDLFVELEKKYAVPGFAEKRIDAEQCARKKYFPQEDVTFEQIYEMLEPDYHGMAQKEVELEREVLRVNDCVKRLYDKAFRMGKRIVIVSDMYLSGNILESILKDKGYDWFEKLYVSSETGCTKASGNMYQYVLRDIGCESEKVMHIGDNLWSDGNACRCAGIGYLYTSEKEAIIIKKVLEKHKRKSFLC